MKKIRAIVARQPTGQFTQRDTHNQNVYIVTTRAGDGYWLSKHSERKRLIVRRSHRITAVVLFTHYTYPIAPRPNALHWNWQPCRASP